MAESSLAGTFFGPYELLHQVGSGGVAVVHRARHIHPQYADRPLAIKVLHERLSDDERMKLLFRREASVLSLIRHKNVVETFEAGVQDGVLYLAMEYVEGRDLENLLWRSQQLKVPIPQDLVLFIVVELLKALAYAHTLHDLDDTPLKLVHRDVNPANVFLSFEGEVKLGDFGVTSLIAGSVQRSREVAGKVGYFAPEQLRGCDIDERTDLYAVGAVLFEALSGRKLFDAHDQQEAMRQNIRGDVPDVAALVPEGLGQIILRSLAKDPNERFSSAEAMLAALCPYIQHGASHKLGLRSLLRTLFVSDHQQTLSLASDLHHRMRPSGHLKVVDLVMPAGQTQDEAAALLQQHGYVVRCLVDAAAIMAALDEPAAASAIWVRQMTIDPRNPLLAGRYGPFGTTPVIALAESVLEGDTLLWAYKLGAVDLLFRPMTHQRLLNAVRAVHVELARPQELPTAQSKARLRTLLVAGGQQLGALLTRALGELGHAICVVDSASAALAELSRRSFELVVVQADGVGTPPGCNSPIFVSAFRGQAGMGTTPMVFVAQQKDPSMVAIDRSAWVTWPCTDASDDLIQRAVILSNGLRAAISELTPKELGQSRLFVRYPTHLPLQMRFGGRVFAAEANNVSRGGMLIQTQQLPATGTTLGLFIVLPSGQQVHVQAVTLRIMLGRSQRADQVQVGVAFTGFSGDNEGHFISYISWLAKALLPGPITKEYAATS